MATIKQIQFKRTKVAGSRPTAAQLAEGELAINLKDRTIFTKDDLNQIIDLGFAKGGEVSGDITQIGNYTQTGNYNLTGDATISGKTTTSTLDVGSVSDLRQTNFRPVLSTTTGSNFIISNSGGLIKPITLTVEGTATSSNTILRHSVDTTVAASGFIDSINVSLNPTDGALVTALNGTVNIGSSLKTPKLSVSGAETALGDYSISIGDNDTGFKWNSDGVFSLVTDSNSIYTYSRDRTYSNRPTNFRYTSDFDATTPALAPPGTWLASVETAIDGNAYGDGMSYLGYKDTAGYSFYFRGGGTFNVASKGGFNVDTAAAFAKTVDVSDILTCSSIIKAKGPGQVDVTSAGNIALGGTIQWVPSYMSGSPNRARDTIATAAWGDADQRINVLETSDPHGWWYYIQRAGSGSSSPTGIEGRVNGSWQASDLISDNTLRVAGAFTCTRRNSAGWGDNAGWYAGATPVVANQGNVQEMDPGVGGFYPGFAQYNYNGTGWNQAFVLGLLGQGVQRWRRGVLALRGDGPVDAGQQIARWYFSQEDGSLESEGPLKAPSVQAGQITSFGVNVTNALGSASIAIGDNDTGLRWGGDGIVQIVANNAIVGGWNSTDIFTEAGKHITSNGNLNQWGGGAIYCRDLNVSSDRRIKKDIKAFENPVDILSTIGGYTYLIEKGFNEDGSQAYEESAGLIAQEVEAVLPRLVKISNDGTKDVKRLNYNGITALNTAAINVHTKEINELKKQLKELKDIVKFLTK
ncbi:large distal tail fiber subunit [Salmonella phage vB_SenM-AKM_NP4]|uniref:Long tail fiber protein Gp37 n=1 Tax=Salmonella phage S16 TaxID=1087482 RepID=FIB37_BPS16|nr:long tail fiber protein distal subunit [Salmonella phage vB_SenM-S16]M1EAS5.1 RecName: Full=Long tail fiber protein Gp37; AltName: Full=Gene product 37; Short=gp37; AltName: Full=Receptor-recognizing protein; Contains: RecName: Full=Mature tail fiber protein Gp37; Contains: RecName: Full=Intramolecular chaperone [Salmonella phage vB_SenM-S16]AEO97172.1 long tail fiber distal subunit [Salmonella phage vB_SenM-S16]WDR21911.1 tail fiber protein [Salmonella phage vB_SenM_UTK0003]WLI71868.1 large